MDLHNPSYNHIELHMLNCSFSLQSIVSPFDGTIIL